VITIALLVATALTVTGAVAAAGTAVSGLRSGAAVAGGALLVVVADGRTLAAGATARSVATAGLPLVLVLAGLVVHGRRSPLLAAVAGAVLAGPVRQALDDPFHDTGCLRLCDPNPLAVFPHPGLADAVTVVGGVALVGGLVLASRGAWPRTLGGLAMAGFATWSLVTGTLAGGVLAGSVAVVLLAAELARAESAAARLTDAVAALATAEDPDDLLARAFGGRPVVLGYPVGDGLVVDRAGRRLPAAAPDQTVVEVSGPTGVVAEVRGQLSGVAPVAVARALRGPARLALENNRLAAEATVRADQVRASAARLVALAEEGRRRLEQDLHDGAQRHVLNLGLAVRAEPGLEDDVRAGAAEVIRAVLDQLRDVAHGISPPELGTGGLAHAFAGLADRSPVPLDAGPVPTVLDAASARAAYRLVEETLRSATAPVAVRLTEEPDCWRVSVAAEQGGSTPPSGSDRFRALGGSLVSQRVGSGWRHDGRLPREEAG
jgi:signal transduction histidine kinase